MRTKCHGARIVVKPHSSRAKQRFYRNRTRRSTKIYSLD